MYKYIITMERIIFYYQCDMCYTEFTAPFSFDNTYCPKCKSPNVKYVKLVSKEVINDNNCKLKI